MQKYYHKGVFYMDEDSTKDEGDVRYLNTYMFLNEYIYEYK
jgi:hypothetical protein